MRIIIVGKGGSGKDFLKNKFKSQGFKACISHTTRPKRENEKDEEDYYFIEKETFKGLILFSEYQEYDNFNGWYYGTPVSEWKSKNIFIKTPRGVSNISKEDRLNCFVIYLDIDCNTRFTRLSKRSDADNVVRRIKADEQDFLNFTDYDLKITNPDF